MRLTSHDNSETCIANANEIVAIYSNENYTEIHFKNKELALAVKESPAAIAQLIEVLTK